MKITSTAFQENELIPRKYTCNGENINPKLEIEEILSETKSLAMVMIDPDSPSGNFIHWLVWNIKPSTKIIEENSVPTGAVEGMTSWEKTGYGGPCPQTGEHRYIFRIYALDMVLNLDDKADINEFNKAIKGHVNDMGEYVGRYSQYN